MRGARAASRSPRPTITAPARVVASLWRYLGFARKAISEGPAESSVATPARGLATSPTASPPRRATISLNVNAGFGGQSTSGFELWSVPMCSLVRQSLDDLVGDVDLAAREHRLLEDQVELLLLGDLVDDARGALLHRGERLVAAQVEVLAQLALQALEVAADVGKLPFLVAARRLRHRHVFALELGLQVAALLLQLGELGVARGEIAFERLLRLLGRRRLAEHALRVDEADLQRLRARGEYPARQHRGKDDL